MKVLLGGFDTRHKGPAQRLALGFSCGVITVLAMWLISTTFPTGRAAPVTRLATPRAASCHGSKPARLIAQRSLG